MSAEDRENYNSKFRLNKAAMLERCATLLERSGKSGAAVSRALRVVAATEDPDKSSVEITREFALGYVHNLLEGPPRDTHSRKKPLPKATIREKATEAAVPELYRALEDRLRYMGFCVDLADRIGLLGRNSRGTVSLLGDIQYPEVDALMGPEGVELKGPNRLRRTPDNEQTGSAGSKVLLDALTRQQIALALIAEVLAAIEPSPRLRPSVGAGCAPGF